MSGIQMDGITYRVRARFESLEERAFLEEGVNAGTMLSGDHERDLVGTITYDAMVAEAAHTGRGVLAGVRRWAGLRVEFSSIRPVLYPGGAAE